MGETSEDSQFVVDEVSSIIKEAVENTIGGNAYQQTKVGQWTSGVVETCLGSLTKLQKPFKYIDLLNQGSKFHSTLKTYLEVCDKSLVTVPPEVEGCWKSVEKILPDVSDVIFTEESVYHPLLKYKGIVDCVAHYRGVPCVIEWKRSNQIKTKLSSTFDAPMQLCAYLGALPWHKNVTIQSGLVVIAYVSGAPANVFQMPLESCETYWVEWLRRVQTYWLKRSPTYVQNEM